MPKTQTLACISVNKVRTPCTNLAIFQFSKTVYLPILKLTPLYNLIIFKAIKQLNINISHFFNFAHLSINSLLLQPLHFKTSIPYTFTLGATHHV